jgi:peptidase M20/M25/M40-like protein
MTRSPELSAGRHKRKPSCLRPIRYYRKTRGGHRLKSQPTERRSASDHAKTVIRQETSNQQNGDLKHQATFITTARTAFRARDAGFTQRLIAIPSENPPGNQYEECARTLFDELDRLGFDGVRREGACVLASVGTGPRTLYFSGHYDVVPEQSPDQFQPRVEGANLFGRGSSDMKSALAAMIHAAVAARDEGLLRAGRIGIVGGRVEAGKEPPFEMCLRLLCPNRGDLRAYGDGSVALIVLEHHSSVNERLTAWSGNPPGGLHLHNNSIPSRS